MRKRVLLALGLIAVVSAPVAQAATPAQKCAAAKLKAAKTKTATELKCYKKAFLAGSQVDAACLAKAQEKFAKAFADAEARGGCASEGDAGQVADSIDAFLAGLIPALEPPKSFAADVQPIFNARCISCHSGSLAPQMLRLESGMSWANLVDVASMEQPTVKRVVAGDPANSYLFQKITNAPGISGSPMPLGSFPMSQPEIDTIEAWIAQGAPDN
jgi:hypothetical protein